MSTMEAAATPGPAKKPRAKRGAASKVKAGKPTRSPYLLRTRKGKKTGEEQPKDDHANTKDEEAKSM